MTITKLMTSIEDHAEEAVNDETTSLPVGVAKSFGWGALQGIFEGFVVLGAATFVYSGVQIVKAIAKAKKNDI